MILGIDGIVFWGTVLFGIFALLAVTVFREDMLP